MANPTQLFSRDTKWRIGVTRSLVSELFANGHITTTLVKAKEIRKHAEKMITKAKNISLSNRRRIEAFLRPIEVEIKSKKKEDAKKVSVAKYLVETIAPKYAKRNGGYTRIYKIPMRQGDSAPMAIIELV